MLRSQYSISGMTCQVCVSKVKSALESLEAGSTVNVQLAAPQATLVTTATYSIAQLQNALNQAGPYTIANYKSQAHVADVPKAPSFWVTYKPLFLIIGFIALVSVAVQFPFHGFSWMLAMRHFMAGFFITFAFFKFLNLRGFASAYAMYDVVAMRWKNWGYVYPFLELLLGLLYLTHTASTATHLATILLLGVSSVGVIRSNLQKNKIQCACLGDVFNLPMSTVTIVEDLGMVAMAAGMLWAETLM